MKHRTLEELALSAQSKWYDYKRLDTLSNLCYIVITKRKEIAKMNLKDFVNNLEGNPLVDITVWRDNYPYTIARMRKDNVIKSPKFNQYSSIEVSDYAKDGRDYVIYLVM